MFMDVKYFVILLKHGVSYFWRRMHLPICDPELYRIDY